MKSIGGLDRIEAEPLAPRGIAGNLEVVEGIVGDYGAVEQSKGDTGREQNRPGRHDYAKPGY